MQQVIPILPQAKPVILFAHSLSQRHMTTALLPPFPDEKDPTLLSTTIDIALCHAGAGGVYPNLRRHSAVSDVPPSPPSPPILSAGAGRTTTTV